MEETQNTPTQEQGSAKNVLVFAKHDYVVSNANVILSKGGFAAHGYTNLMEATDYIRTGEVDVVLIMGGVDPHDKISLTRGLAEFAPQAKVVDHFGGPATLLHEVLTALQS
jgi:DNA-binding NarL/FixJ family response regulator